MSGIQKRSRNDPEMDATFSFHMDMVNLNQLDQRKLENLLKAGKKEDVLWFVQTYFAGACKAGAKSMLFRQYLLLDMYFTVMKFLKEQNFSQELFPEPFSSQEKIEQIVSTPENTKRYLTGLITKAIRLRDETVCNRYGDIVEEVKGYIAKNYADDELSLNSLASYVNLSPNHLSMVFSQQTGQTFIKYLTEYRMKKAKELLRCTNRKSAEISMEVGYKDPHYFSYLFKKTQSMTPTQYREC